MGHLNLGSIHPKAHDSQPASLSWSGNMLADAFQQYNAHVDDALNGLSVSLDYTKVGLATVTAIAESTLYTFLMIGSFVVSSETSSKYSAYLRSSSFSIGWALTASVCTAMYQTRVPECEHFARQTAAQISPTLLSWCYQRQDRSSTLQDTWVKHQLTDQKKETANLLMRVLTQFLPVEDKNNEALNACRKKDPTAVTWLTIRLIDLLFTDVIGKYAVATELGQATCDAIVEKRSDKAFQSLLKQVTSNGSLSTSFKKILKLSPQEFASYNFESLPAPISAILETYRSIASLEHSEDSSFTECITTALEEIDRKRIPFEEQAARMQQIDTDLERFTQEREARNVQYQALNQEAEKSILYSSRPKITAQKSSTEYLSIGVGEHCAWITTIDGEEISIPHTKFRNPYNHDEDPLVTFNRFAQNYDRFNYVITSNGCLEIWPPLKTGR